jgi:hypothetical protein
MTSSDHSRSLSPFDPLLFGMLGARAMAHVRLAQYEEAAEWAIKASARPNAHSIILAIAAHSLALAGRVEEEDTRRHDPEIAAELQRQGLSGHFSVLA